MGLKHPGLMLKYSTFKNLASMAASRDDLETAMEFYLEVKIGTLSLLQCNNKCWNFDHFDNTTCECLDLIVCCVCFLGGHVGFH